MQDHVRRVGHALGAHLAGGGAEQRQQLGRAAADVLMRLTNRPALRPPGLTGLWDGLVRTCLILTPHGDAYLFSDVVREFDEPPFYLRCRSTIVTTPALCFRYAVPVGQRTGPLVQTAPVLQHAPNGDGADGREAPSAQGPLQGAQ